MKKVAVLGAGMVGSAMAIDLKNNFDVTIADINEGVLDELVKTHAITTQKIDISNTKELTSFLQPFDLVVCAVPGFMGYKTLQTIIQCGKNVADISFFPEDALLLSELAKEKGVTAIVDCGVAPGMDNIILGYHNQYMQISDFVCLVGGLPKVRTQPFEYKAPFSPIDVIEEYTRPARYQEHGEIVTREPLTDPELLEFKNVGTLESFNTDGLRSLLFTMPHIPNMKEKTLRYPGHIDLIKKMKLAGFFSETEISIGNKEIVPLDFTAKMLIDKWKLEPDEKEFTVMRVIVKGKEQGVKKEITYDLYDEYNEETNTSSMARTTGYTCTAALNLIANGTFNKHGVFPPELVGSDEVCFRFFINYLNDRGVIYEKTERVIA